MTKEEVTEQQSPWETESGLIDDVDAYIVNAHFGVKEEYLQAVVDSKGDGQKGLMFLFDLEDTEGNIIGQQGYSVGTGWEASEDGASISHAKRKNVVTNSMYGQLQVEVVKNLGVDMVARGLPTEAASWEGLGFHWMLKAHKTMSGQEKQGLMPTEYLGEKNSESAEEAPTKPTAKPAAKATSPAVAKALQLVKETGTPKEFMLKIVKIPEIVGDDALMAQCMDQSETGFFKKNKK
ncbi:MAG: hypothetical protein PHU23_19310 [Dehalococcoidales bacterium]|nr:hypothetical protein [Dehalococcoidales bacterium]